MKTTIILIGVNILMVDIKNKDNLFYQFFSIDFVIDSKTIYENVQLIWLKHTWS